MSTPPEYANYNTGSGYNSGSDGAESLTSRVSNLSVGSNISYFAAQLDSSQQAIDDAAAANAAESRRNRSSSSRSSRNSRSVTYTPARDIATVFGQQPVNDRPLPSTPPPLGANHYGILNLDLEAQTQVPGTGIHAVDLDEDNNTRVQTWLPRQAKWVIDNSPDVHDLTFKALPKVIEYTGKFMQAAAPNDTIKTAGNGVQMAGMGFAAAESIVASGKAIYQGDYRAAAWNAAHAVGTALNTYGNYGGAGDSGPGYQAGGELLEHASTGGLHYLSRNAQTAEAANTAPVAPEPEPMHPSPAPSTVGLSDLSEQYQMQPLQRQETYATGVTNPVQPGHLERRNAFAGTADDFEPAYNNPARYASSESSEPKSKRSSNPSSSSSSKHRSSRVETHDERKARKAKEAKDARKAAERKSSGSSSGHHR